MSPSVRSPAGRSRARRVASILFRGLTVLALLYLGWAFAAEWPAISSWRPGASQVLAVFALVLVYGASLFLLAENWHRFVSVTGATEVDRSVTFPSFARTQIAKYLPGNVLHLVGRHVWLAGRGVRDHALLAALALEVVVLIAGAITVAALGMRLTPPGEIFPPLLRALADPILALGLSVVLACLAAMALPRRAGANAAPYRAVLFAYGLSTLFFFGQGLVFYALCALLSSDAGLYLVAIAAAGWIGGFLTPGAPGGVGPREILLLTLIGDSLPASDVLISIALFRCVTTAGDLFCCALGFAIFHPSDASSAPLVATSRHSP